MPPHHRSVVLALPLALLLAAPPSIAQEGDTADETAPSAAPAGEEPPPSQPTWPIPRRGVSVPLPEGTLAPGDPRAEVVLSIVVGPEGEVEDVAVSTSSGNEAIDAAAEEAAWLLDFFPSTLDGQPIRVTIDYPFVFLPPAPPGPRVLPARLSGRIEVKGSLEPVAFLDVSLFASLRAEEAEQSGAGDSGEADPAPEGTPSEPAHPGPDQPPEVPAAAPDDPPPAPVVVPDADAASSAPPPEPPRLRDLVVDEEPLRVVVTDAAGSFDLGEIPPGIWVVAIGSAGFRIERFVEVLDEGVEREVVYRVRPTGVPETIVVARRESDVPERVLTREQLKKMPGAGNDPMAAMQSLPGVVHAAPSFSAGDQAQAPVLRGASAEDSVLYLDGLPVPIIFHTLATYSITGDFLVDKAWLRPAAAEARFGDLTGGVVGLELRSPRSDRVGGFIDPGIGMASLGLEGPITAKSRFYVGIRRSYYDIVMRLVWPKDAPMEMATAPYFQDQQVILETDAAPWLKFSLGYIGTLDGLKMLEAQDEEEGESEEEPFSIEMETDMHRIFVRADMSGPNGLTNRLMPALTFWGSRFEFTQAFQYDDRHTTFDLADDLHLPLLPWLALDAGAIMEVDRLKQWRSTPVAIREDTGPRAWIGDEENLTGREVETRTWLGGYVGLPVKPHARLTIAPEFRVDWFQKIGEVVPQVRGRVGWRPIDPLRLSLAGGRYVQSPSADELNEISGNPDLGPEGAWHVNLGAQVAPGPWLDLDLQAYAKFLDHQSVSSIEAASFTGIADMGDWVEADDEDPTHGLSNSGIGRIWGMELFARFGVLRRIGITGWLGYSLSWAQRRDFEDEDWRWFQHDRRHAITALVQLALPGEFGLGARFQLQTGAPKTPIEDSVYYADWGMFVPVYGELYSARSKPFHQLDLRIDKRFRRDRHTIDIYIDVQNVYAAAMSDFEIPSYDYREEHTFFMVPAFNFAVRVEF